MQVKEVFSKLNRSLVPALFLLSFIFLLAGCEDTESYEGVTFKPQQAEDKPLDTSVFVLVVKKAGPEHQKGKDSISHHNSLIGSEWIPVNDMILLFDGERKLVSTTRGMYNLTSLSGGTHTLSIVTSDKPLVTLFQTPLVVNRSKMTIVLIDVTDVSGTSKTGLIDGGYRICYQSIDYNFILKKPFKKLTSEYLAMGRLVSKYEDLLEGSKNIDKWDDIFRKECRDEEGHISDRLMALKYIQGIGVSLQWHSSSWVGSIGDEYTGTILVRGNDEDGKAKAFERFCVTRSKPGETFKSEPQWKIVSIGIDL